MENIINRVPGSEDRRDSVGNRPTGESELINRVPGSPERSEGVLGAAATQSSQVDPRAPIILGEGTVSQNADGSFSGVYIDVDGNTRTASKVVV